MGSYMCLRGTRGGKWHHRKHLTMVKHSGTWACVCVCVCVCLQPWRKRSRFAIMAGFLHQALEIIRICFFRAELLLNHDRMLNMRKLDGELAWFISHWDRSQSFSGWSCSLPFALVWIWKTRPNSSIVLFVHPVWRHLRNSAFNCYLCDFLKCLIAVISNQ